MIPITEEEVELYLEMHKKRIPILADYITEEEWQNQDPEERQTMRQQIMAEYLLQKNEG